MAYIRRIELVEGLHRSSSDQPATIDGSAGLSSPIGLSRRSFIRTMLGGALMTVGGRLYVAMPPAIAQSTVTLRQLKGTKDGLILESLDGGRTWQRVANFGAHCAVVTLRDSQGIVLVELAVAGHRFVLKSADARTWRTI